MKQKVTQYLRNLFSGINHPVMVAAMLISFGLWYLNRLGHTYTDTVTIPVSIVSGPESPIGVPENEHMIECRIQGTGYELLKYRLWPSRHRMEIDLRQIDLRPIEGSDRSEVSASSLYYALAGQWMEGQLQSIGTTPVEIRTAPFRVRRVPVRSRMEFVFKNQYMPIGPILFTPDSVEVKSLDFLLDTLRAVYTAPRRFSHVDGSLHGNISLQPLRDVLFSTTGVAFRLTVEEYTENDLTLPLSLLNAPADRQPVILPENVSVRLNVARSRYASISSGEIRAYIDYNDRTTNLGKSYKVYISAPEGVVVREIDPLYVELLFENP
jgi:hypothetical protein